MGHRYKRTPQHSAEQKARTEKNRTKVRKPIKMASEKTKQRKFEIKEQKRQKYLIGKLKGKAK